VTTVLEYSDAAAARPQKINPINVALIDTILRSIPRKSDQHSSCKTISSKKDYRRGRDGTTRTGGALSVSASTLDI